MSTPKQRRLAKLRCWERWLCRNGFHDYKSVMALNGIHLLRCRRCGETIHRSY